MVNFCCFPLLLSFSMARASAATLNNPHARTGVRIVVAGDQATGKSSFIIAAATDSFPPNVPPVLPPTTLPEYLYPDHVPISVIDTSSRAEDLDKVDEELQRADAVVLTYACDQPKTFENLSVFWLPRLRRLKVKVPVIVAGCKRDLRDQKQQVSLKQLMSPIMQKFQQIETHIECSACGRKKVLEVLYCALKAVLYPIAPLVDQESQTLKPRCVQALRRIFILCDHDRDGALSDTELNDYQVKCFNAPLQSSEIVGLKEVVQEKLPEGVNDHGLTLAGFLFLNTLFIEKGRLEMTWTVLRKFGYDEIKLADDLIPPLKQAPHQDGMLQPHELEKLFSTAPGSPWIGTPYEDAGEKSSHGGLSLDAFLSQWALMTLLDPTYSVENLIYIGYAGDPSSAIHVTSRRCLDHKKPHSERNVFQCFVFGPRKAGKSALLNSFIGRAYPYSYILTTEDRFAVNVLDNHEIPEHGVKRLLSNKESLAACDVAVFVHDRSDKSSWETASQLLEQIAGHGFEVPCLIVAAKDDLYSFPMARQESTRVSQVMGVEAPIPISAKLGQYSCLLRRIIAAAEHPYLSIPETKAWRSRKLDDGFSDCSAMFVWVGAAVLLGLAAYFW